MLIDTHCHLSFKAFDDDWREAAKRAREKDTQMICVGAAKATSEKSITIAEESDGVFASIGIHPTHAEDEEFDAAWFSEQAQHPKVVAIGETGVDHYHLDEARRAEILEKQEVLLRQHLKIAKENNLPVMLHTRDGKTESTGEAYSHLMRVLKECEYYNGVVHCFGGEWETAQKMLDLGLMLSFTGIVTFKNASDSLKEVAKNVPADRYMIETDSPYLAPEPYRGKQNEPAYVEHVARGIALIRGEDYDTVASQTTENAKKFFNLP
ncbi:MAG: TatD family hydrolase [bacterium]|nr:TatD family hydrolase [bacterium]